MYLQSLLMKVLVVVGWLKAMVEAVLCVPQMDSNAQSQPCARWISQWSQSMLVRKGSVLTGEGDALVNIKS